MLVKDVMTSNPVTVQMTTSVNDLQSLMKKHDIDTVPVTDKQGALVGLITKADLRKSTPSDATSLDMFELSYLLSKLTVEKVMIKSVKTTTENTAVEEAARLLEDYNISCLPVVKNGLVIGIVTKRDLFRSFIDMFGTRHAGVRATFTVEDKPGVLNTFTEKLAELKGNIVSLVTADVSETGRRRVTIRVTDVNLNQMEDLIKECSGILEDIRNV